MRRRQFLAGMGVGSLSGLTGCLAGGEGPLEEGTPSKTSEGSGAEPPGADSEPGAGEATATGTASGTATESATPPGTPTELARRGDPADICEKTPLQGPDIYAIIEPTFAEDWSAHDIPGKYQLGEGSVVGEDHTVIGLTDGDRARAYPLSVLFLHEIVNDEFGGPVVVTYCPLCASGMVADRLVDDEPTQFLVSGLLWTPPGAEAAASQRANRTFGTTREDGERGEATLASNLVMYDQATGSYWSQFLAQAICGPKTGTRLSIRPSTVTTWGEWRSEHPDTEVLLPPPHSGTRRGPG